MNDDKIYSQLLAYAILELFNGIQILQQNRKYQALLIMLGSKDRLKLEKFYECREAVEQMILNSLSQQSRVQEINLLEQQHHEQQHVAPLQQLDVRPQTLVVVPQVQNSIDRALMRRYFHIVFQLRLTLKRLLHTKPREEVFRYQRIVFWILHLSLMYCVRVKALSLSNVVEVSALNSGSGATHHESESLSLVSTALDRVDSTTLLSVATGDENPSGLSDSFLSLISSTTESSTLRPLMNMTDPSRLDEETMTGPVLLKSLADAGYQLQFILNQLYETEDIDSILSFRMEACQIINYGLTLIENRAGSSRQGVLREWAEGVMDITQKYIDLKAKRISPQDKIAELTVLDQEMLTLGQKKMTDLRNVTYNWNDIASVLWSYIKGIFNQSSLSKTNRHISRYQARIFKYPSCPRENNARSDSIGSLPSFLSLAAQ